MRIERAARDLGAVLLPFRSVAGTPDPRALRAVVVDLIVEGSLAAVEQWKAVAPAVPVVAVVAGPSPDVWKAAEAAGADLVVTRGTAHRRLAGFVEAYRPLDAHRIRAGAVRDFEGRLGCLARVAHGGEDIALFRVGYRIVAVSNRCPHAGASLADGALDGSTLTCPLHGSQFDVTDGRRARGPADDALRSYAVIVEGGDVYVEVGPAP